MKGTVLPGEDVVARSGALTVAAGETIAVAIRGDTAVETDGTSGLAAYSS